MINFAGAIFRSVSSRKADVRAEAGDRGLAIANKPDSHDICFIANGDTAGFLDGASAVGQATSWTSRARRLASMVDRIGLPSGSVEDFDSAHQPPTASLASCSSITPTTNTITVGPRMRLGQDHQMLSSPSGPASSRTQNGQVRYRFGPMASPWTPGSGS